MSYGGKKRSKSLLLSPGLRPCSPMCMLSQVSELPCLTIPIRLVCPQADRKASKQNSCPWQFKMSLQRRLLTVTSDLPGACLMAYCPPGSICGMLSIPRALPPVTHSSALQAPERMWGCCDLTTHPHRTDVSQALWCLARHYHEVHRRRRCARIDSDRILLPGGQYARG